MIDSEKISSIHECVENFQIMFELLKPQLIRTLRVVCASNTGKGANGRTRTDDLLFTKQLLYQLSYIGAGARSRIRT